MVSFQAVTAQTVGTGGSDDKPQWPFLLWPPWEASCLKARQGPRQKPPEGAARGKTGVSGPRPVALAGAAEQKPEAKNEQKTAVLLETSGGQAGSAPFFPLLRRHREAQEQRARGESLCAPAAASGAGRPGSRAGRAAGAESTGWTAAAVRPGAHLTPPRRLCPAPSHSSGCLQHWQAAGPRPLPQKTVVFKKKQERRQLPTAGVSYVPRPGGVPPSQGVPVPAGALSALCSGQDGNYCAQPIRQARARAGVSRVQPAGHSHTCCKRLLTECGA